MLRRLRRTVSPEPLAGRAAFIGYVTRKSGGSVAQETCERYWKYAAAYIGWLEGERPSPASVDAYYARVLIPKYRQNSRIVVSTALNWYLRFLRVKDEDGEPLRFPVPSKELLESPRLLDEDGEWKPLRTYLETHGELRELAMAMLQHDTFLRPGDLVRVRVDQLVLDERPHVEGKVQRKTGYRVRPFITRDTAQVLRRYLEERRPTTYLFESAPGVPFSRRWPWQVFRRVTKRAGLTAGITSRLFRRSGATRWRGDIKDLALQGGWVSTKTIFDHYRQAEHDRHWEAFEETFEPKKKDEDPAFR
jgi:integrase